MARILVALLAARVVTSFTGGAASIRPHRTALGAATMTKPEKSGPLKEALPGIHLPGGSSVLDTVGETYLPTNLKVGKWLLATKGKEVSGPKMLNNGKDSLESWREVVASKATSFKGGVPKNYKSFGEDRDYASQLVALLSYNPFFAAALTPSGDGGFELKSHDPENENPSFFLEAVRTLQRPGERVNFKFDVTPGGLEIASFQVFDEEGNRIWRPAHDVDYYATAALYDTLFFAEAVHATIHVFHYLMTNALAKASEKLPPLEDLAAFYEKNVDVKYAEVGLLLLNAEGEDALISGPEGFGSSQEIRTLLKTRVIDAWGQAKTCDEFFDAFFCAPREDLESAGLLTEFFRHTELVEDFAEDVAEALQKKRRGTSEEDAEKQFQRAEKALAKYVSKCGEWKGTVSTIDTWVQLMGATGVIHGSTLSMTRLMGKSAVMRWRNIDSQEWEENDSSLISGGLGTITGMEKGRHVMACKKSFPFSFPICRGKLQKVLDTYNGYSKRLKKAYTAKLKKLPDFSTLGYIYSDWAKDGFDGKQLTVTTYI